MTAGGIIVAVPDVLEPAAVTPPGPKHELRVLEGETMGTFWSARFFAPGFAVDSHYRKPIESVLQSVVRQMSHWVADSDLSKFVATSAGLWQSLQPEFFRVLDFALQVAAETGGAYDPTVGRFVDEWGFGPAQKRQQVPDPQAITALRRQTPGSSGIELDRLSRKARHSGAAGLDLSAVAKGFAVDQIGRVLENLGISSYLVEIGGELRASGLKPQREPWWVAIEPPGAEWIAGFPEIRIALSGWSIATSGDYRRYFEADGRRWAHTIDPRTGNPVSGEIASVAVIHKDCMAADAYSTALMVMGAEQGIAFAERKGLPALFTVRTADGLSVRCTDRFYRMANS